MTVYGTADGVRADPQLGMRLDSQQIDETPLLGRKITSLPLLNSAFRSAKGTGDLFVNATYFVTGVGGRRQAAVTIDGATNDEPWGRQTMLATVPVGAVQEMAVLSNAFSAEFGWTSSAALNIVTKAGTNTLHGEALFLGRPGRDAGKGLSARVRSARRPSRPACHRLSMALRRPSCPPTFLTRSVRCRSASAARSPGIARTTSPPSTTRIRIGRAPITSPLVAAGHDNPRQVPSSALRWTRGPQALAGAQRHDAREPRSFPRHEPAGRGLRQHAAERRS